MYSFFYGHDDICMYLSLRVQNCDIEDQDGLNIFIKYLMKKDIQRMSQLLKRGSKINYQNKYGKTPLHHAIEANLPAKIVKWLVKMGSDPLIQDNQGQSCCDLAAANERYTKIKELQPEPRSAQIEDTLYQKTKERISENKIQTLTIQTSEDEIQLPLANNQFCTESPIRSIETLIDNLQ